MEGEIETVMCAWERRGKKEEACKHKFSGLCSVTGIEHLGAKPTEATFMYVYIYFMHVL